MRTRVALLGLPLCMAACDLQCNSEHSAQVAISVDGKSETKVVRKADVDGDVDVDVDLERKEVERKEIEVEVEPTVCDALDLEIERIVLVPADPPFHDVPRERVSIRVTNGAARAVEVDSGTDAVFLDERRTVIKADLHQSDWFMPLKVPAKSAVVVQIIVPEHSGKALRTVEVEVAPDDDPFTKCKLADELLGAKPGAAAPTEPTPKPSDEPAPSKPAEAEAI